MLITRFTKIFILTALICFAYNTQASGKSMNSVLEMESVKSKYNLVSHSNYNTLTFASSDEFSDSDNDLDAGEKKKIYKSPAKAFILSMAIPGLGQYYNGSRLKPLAFLGVEATAWILNIKYNNEGDDITDEFEAFQRANWSRDTYEQKYLLWTYGYTDDDEIPPSNTEVSHNLPEEETQQFFEMTGKYNQFAWGWNDAELNGNYIDNYDINNPAPPIASGSTTPYSAKREAYENRRNDANNKYDKARKMIYVALINRLVSSFEAMFQAKSINKNARNGNSVFSTLKVRAKIASYEFKYDTPYVTVSFKL